MSSIPTSLISILFLFSGFSTLVYQTLWIRVLSLELGSTASAMGFVLGVFFLGLALGSFLGARVIRWNQKSLYVYAALELFIGVSSGVILYLLFHLPATVFLKYLSVSILLSPSTIAMGATWPVFIKSIAEYRRAKISLLYSWNTFGAALGAIITGFHLIPKFGIIPTNFIAVAINIAIAGSIYFSKKYWRAYTNHAEKSNEKIKYRKNKLEIFEDKIIVEERKLLKFFYYSNIIVGFVSITLEVVWTKYLSLFFGTNIYGVSLIVGLFLIGIALGSLLLTARVKKALDREKIFLWIVFSASVSILVTTIFLNHLPVFTSIIAFLFKDYISLFTVKVILASLVVLPPTALLGSLLPLSMATSSKETKFTRDIGNLYSINTVGAILGAIFSGVLLIPVFGSSFLIQLSLLFLASIFLLAVYFSVKKPKVRIFYVVAILLLLVGNFYFANVDFRKLIQSAYFQYQSDQSSYSEIIDNYSEKTEEFEKIFEGNSSIISLSYKNNEEGDSYLWLKTNGLNESYYSEDMLNGIPKYEALLGFIPYALHPNPHNAFVIGYGGGYTVDFLSNRYLSMIDVAEIEPAILKAADYVTNGKNPIKEKQNVNIILGDARVVLGQMKHAKYDLIISQPSHSWLLGVANLFTKEFFEIIKQNLSEQGVFSQWLNLYNIDVDTLRSIFYTFYSVFPHGMIFSDISDSELILIGMKQPIKFSYKRLSSLSKDVLIRQQLEQIPFSSPYDILPQYLISREEALQFSGNRIPLNTDTNAFAEVRQAKLFYANQENQSSDILNQLFTGDYSVVVEDFWLRKNRFYNDILNSILRKSNNFWKFHVLFQKSEKLSLEKKETAKDYKDLGDLSYRMERYASAAKFLEKSLALQPNVLSANLLVSTYLASRKFDKAETILDKYKFLKSPQFPCYLLELCLATNNFSRTEIAFKALEKKDAKDSCGDVGDRLWGEYFLQARNAEKAIPFLEAYNEKYPSDIFTQEKLFQAYLTAKKRSLALMFYDSLPIAIDNEIKRLEQVANFYRDNHLENDAKILEEKIRDLSK